MTPHSKDGINYTLTGCTLLVLTADVILNSDDYVRDVQESPMYSQDGGWDTTYKCDEWKGPRWHKMEDELPAWVGKSYQDYLDFASDDYNIDMEIVRVIK